MPKINRIKPTRYTWPLYMAIGILVAVVLIRIFAPTPVFAGNEKIRSFNADDYEVGATGSHWGDFELYGPHLEENYNDEIVEIDGVNFLPVEPDYDEGIEMPEFLPSDPFYITPDDIGETFYFNTEFITTGGNQFIHWIGGIFEFFPSSNDLLIASGDGIEFFEIEPELNKNEIYEAEAEIEITNYYQSGDDWILAFDIDFNIVNHPFDLSMTSNIQDLSDELEVDLKATSSTLDPDSPFYINNLYIGTEEHEPPEPPEIEPFEAFDADINPADFITDYSVHLSGIVNDFGLYSWGDPDGFPFTNALAYRFYTERLNPETNEWEEYEKPVGAFFPYPPEDGINFVEEWDHLEPGGEYRYRIRFKYVSGSTGTVLADHWTEYEYFSTELEEDDPVLNTLPAVDITDESAYLRGEVEDMGDAEELTVYFEYKTMFAEEWETTPSGSVTDPTVIGYELTGLDPGTHYLYRFRTDEIVSAQESFSTLDPEEYEPPPPVDPPEEWPDYYDAFSDDDFTDPTGSIDAIGSTVGGMFNAISERMEPFDGLIDGTEAQTYGGQAGEIVPMIRAYLEEFNVFFGGLPVGEVFILFLMINILVVGFILVRGVIQLIPFV